MKKRNVILSSLVIGGIAVWAFTFAANNWNLSWSNLPFQWMMKTYKMWTWDFRGMRWEFNVMKWRGFGLMEYIDMNSLTQDQKTELNKLMQDHKTKMDEIFKKYQNNTWSVDQMQTEIKNLWTEHMNSLRKFVAQDKLTQFDEFVAKWPQAPMLKIEKFWSWMKMNWGPLNGYIDYNSLTQEQKTQFDNIMSWNMTKQEALMDEFKTKSDALWKENMSNLRQFVPQDKQADFDKMVEQWPQSMGPKGFGKWGKHRGEWRWFFWPKWQDAQTWINM